MYLYLHIGGGQVGYVTGFDLSFLDSLGNTLYQRADSLGERQFTDDEGLIVEFLYLGTHLQHTATLSFVVFTHIDGTAGGEIGIERERLSLQITDGSVAYLIEVMRQDLG